MTAPTTETVTTVNDDDLLNNDEAMAAAISSVVERKQHLLPDEPAPNDGAPDAPPDAPAPADPATEPAKDGADSTTPEADGDAAADPPEPDPFGTLLSAAKPLTYKVNGTERTFDGLMELPDGKGALVSPDKVNDLRNLIARYDSNAEGYRDLRGQMDAYESRFGGMDGITAKLELAAQTDAAALKIITALRSDPTQFVTVVDNQIVPNRAAIEWLERSAALEAREAKWQVRQEWEATAQTAQRSQSDAQVRQTAVPGYIAQHHTDLHPDDRAFLEGDAAKYLITATKEHAALGYPEGMLLVDAPRIARDAAYLKGLRDKATPPAPPPSAVKAQQAAAAENARRAPAPKPRAQTLPPRNPETGEWVRPKRLSPAEITDRVLAGLPIGGATGITE